MTKYQEYQLQWMIDQGYSLADLISGLNEFAKDAEPGTTIQELFNEWELDSLIEDKEYQNALSRVDSIIADKGHDLSCFAYFDRFLPKKERYDAGVIRAEIYDLQWKRIEILHAKSDEAVLKSALEDYADIIGYNQERAKALLKQIMKEQK